MLNTIVIVHDQAYVSGGAAKIAIGQAIALKKCGYDVIYFCALGPIDKSLETAGIKCLCIGGMHIGNTYKPKALLQGIWNRYAYRKFLELLLSIDSQKTIVHIHGWTKALSSSIFKACRDANIKSFVTLHDYFVVCPNGGLYNYKKNCICKIVPGSIKCVICNCDKRGVLQKIYRDIRQIFLLNELKLLKPRFIYITEFSEKMINKNNRCTSDSVVLTNHVEVMLSDRYKVENNEIYAFIGRVSDEKGIELFCHVIENMNLKGIVIGDGPLKKIYEEMYPEIDFVGWLNSEQIAVYLQSVRCMVVTSKLYETMGLTVIEMQSKGIPCIVPETFAGSEFIQAGVSGLVYKTEEISTLFEKLEITKDDQQIENLSINFFKNFKKDDYCIEKHVEKLLEIYKM